MAKPIKNTPTLYGKDAENFLKNINKPIEPLSDEEQKRIKESFAKMAKIVDKSNSDLSLVHYKKLLLMCEHFEIECVGVKYVELCWKILNKLSANLSPLDIVDKIKLFGMVCFNNSEFSHPIDYMFEMFQEFKK